MGAVLRVCCARDENVFANVMQGRDGCYWLLASPIISLASSPSPPPKILKIHKSSLKFWNFLRTLMFVQHIIFLLCVISN